MADLEFEGSISGIATVSGAVIAARFLEAAIAQQSTVAGIAAVSPGNLEGASDGAAAVAGGLSASPSADGSVAGVTSVAAALGRKRGLLSEVAGASAIVAQAAQRLGAAGRADGVAAPQGGLGIGVPFSGAVTLAPEISAVVETGGTILQDIYLHVTGEPVFNDDDDPVTGKPGTWTVPVTLRRGGTAGTRIPTGAAAVKWGEYSASPTTEFTGGIILTSDLSNAPYVDVFTVAKNDGGTVMPWDDAAVKPRVRMGNLRGVLGNALDKWGIAMSTDLADANAPYIEASNEGLTVKDADVEIIDGTFYVGNAGETDYLKWDGSSVEIAADGGGLTNINGGYIQTSTITLDKLVTGTNLPFAVNPLLYLPFRGPMPYESNFTGSAVGHRGQHPASKGSLIFRPGRFGKAAQMGEPTTNLVTNPSAESANATDGITSVGGNYPTLAKSSGRYLYGAYSLRMIYPGDAVTRGVAWSATVTSGLAYSASLYIWVSRTSGTLHVDVAGSGVDTTNITFTASTTGWQRLVIENFVPSSSGSLSLRVYSSNTDPFNGTVWVDGVQIEQKAYTTPYCDGSLGTGHSWSGSAHASTSSRTATQLSFMPTGNVNAPVGTVMAWVYIDSTGAALYKEIVRLLGSVASTAIVLRINGGKLQGQWGSTATSVNGATTLTTGVWHHVAITYDGVHMRLYLDGQPDSSPVATSGMAVDIAQPIYIGYPGGTTDQLNGLMEDFAILDTALSSDQVNAVYASNNPLAVGQGNYDLLLTGGMSGGWVQGNGDGLAGYSADGTLQSYFGSGGKLFAGNGKVSLSAGGINLAATLSNWPTPGGSEGAKILFTDDSGNAITTISQYQEVGAHGELQEFNLLTAMPVTTGFDRKAINIGVTNSAESNYAKISLGRYLYPSGVNRIQLAVSNGTSGESLTVQDDGIYASEMRVYSTGGYYKEIGGTFVAGSLFVPLATPLTAAAFDGDAWSTTSKSALDLSTHFGVPDNIKAILCRIAIRDSGSSTNDCIFYLSPNNTANNGPAVDCKRIANDVWVRDMLVVPTTATGNVYYQIAASGVGTMDVIWEIWGYWI